MADDEEDECLSVRHEEQIVAVITHWTAHSGALKGLPLRCD